METMILTTILWYLVRKIFLSRVHSVSCKDAEKRIKNLSREIEELRHEKMCKVCLDTVSDMVLLPCSHLCVCRSCGNVFQRCPVCRMNIRAKVKVYSA